MRLVLPRLYVILDAALLTVPEKDCARNLVDAGVRLIQYRNKNASTRQLFDASRELAAFLNPLGVRCIVNDRADVAALAGADGVHVGQDDMDVADARRLLGPDAIIGLSVKTAEDAQAAQLNHLTYVAIGGVFPTTSKDNKTSIGPDGLRKLVAAVHARVPNYPIGAIAGITEANTPDVIAAGADGICVISALSSASDPAAMARKLRGIVDASLAKRGAR